MSDESSVQNTSPTDNHTTIQPPYPPDVQASEQLPSSLPETSPLLSTPTAPSLSPDDSTRSSDLNPPAYVSNNVNAPPYPVSDVVAPSGNVTITPGQVSTAVAPNEVSGGANPNLPYPSGPTAYYQPDGQPTSDQMTPSSGQPPPASQPTGPQPPGPPQSGLPNYVPQYTGYGATAPGPTYTGKPGNPDFVTPPPPPSYAESTYNMMQSSPPQQYMIRSVADYPTQMTCPTCQQNVVSEIEYINGGLVYLCSFILIVIGLWIFCCCFIPFFMDSLKDVNHRCPNCHTYLGRYNKL